MPTRMKTRNELFIDTAGWVALADADQPLHEDMVISYQQAVAEKRKLVTTNYVITELVPVLTSRARIPRQLVLELVDSLLATPHLEIVHIDHALHTEAWALLKARPDKEWSLVDASSFVLMQQRGITEALTTDHHYEQAGCVRLPVQ
jgi:predicted nucleic acid-binding protein